MESANPLAMCVASFVTVFTLLTFLALAMRVITLIFPQRASAADAVTVAAISAAVNATYPGARLTRIEEEP